MKIVGVKHTHDASVCLIEDGVLQWCHELEKISNGERYSKMERWEQVDEILASEGLELDQVDSVALDGWKRGMTHLGAPVAGYSDHEFTPLRRPGERQRFGYYTSYDHVYNHVIGSYMCSPLGAAREPAHVLVWDGGTPPRLYHVAADGTVRFKKMLHELCGIMYGVMGYYWGPFKREDVIARREPPLPCEQLYGGYSMPGKLMGWMGLGKVREEWMHPINQIYAQIKPKWKRPLGYNQDGILEHKLCRAVHAATRHVPEADVMATLHAWLSMKTLRELEGALPGRQDLIFTGGCALNIKLNSLLSRNFDLWVPPFPNDSGSAIGAACAEWHYLTGETSVEWSVFSGPRLLPPASRQGWRGHRTHDASVASVLAQGDVVCFLEGRAELGPRALGARSLLADPRLGPSKIILNECKGREDWRPVSPVALHLDAKELFMPPYNDHYMLYDHGADEEAREKLPAVIHVDGTARLQIATEQTPVFKVLEAFKEITGYGVLCNTSANFRGKGFFPSVQDAQRWAETEAVNWVYGDGVLYKRDWEQS